MKLRSIATIACVALITLSCSGFMGCKSLSLLSDAPTPKIAIANLHAADGIAQNIGADYAESPTCIVDPVTHLPNAIPCSNPAIVVKVKAAGAKAKITIDAADQAVHDNPGIGTAGAAGVLADAKAALEVLTALETLQAFTSTVTPATAAKANDAATKVAAVKVDPQAYAAAKAKLATQ